MLRRLAHVLFAFVFALAALPISVRAMPMPSGMTGTAIQQHCPSCPHHPGTNPDEIPACQALACAGAVATLPAPVLLPGRVFLPAAYLVALTVRWTGAQPAPDPLPPRSIALV
ncbi:MAG: hypothetical protein M3Y41_01805 [Pseudomonadota bacterium]|nr:hypothetical protein [Pseudomonadota bacterium]